MDTQQLQLFQTFEEIRQKKDGVEFWFARDLQKVLGYANWQNFQNAIGKAKESIESASG
jgi:DNA-damage-inducible protein D